MSITIIVGIGLIIIMLLRLWALSYRAKQDKEFWDNLNDDAEGELEDKE